MSVIVLDLDKEGKGNGTMAIGVNVGFDRDTGKVKIENYSSEPLRLTNVAPKK